MIKWLARKLCGHKPEHVDQEVIVDWSNFLPRDDETYSGLVVVRWHTMFGVDSYVYFATGEDREDADFVPVGHELEWQELCCLIVDTMRYGALRLNLRTWE